MEHLGIKEDLQTEEIITLLRISLSIEEKPTDFKKKLYNQVLISLNRHFVKNEKLTDYEIVKRVIDFLGNRYKLAENWNTTKSRLRAFVVPRQIAMNLIKSNTKYSLTSIGNMFGGRDHATVLHALKTITNLNETDFNFKDELEIIIEDLRLNFVPYLASETI